MGPIEARVTGADQRKKVPPTHFPVAPREVIQPNLPREKTAKAEEEQWYHLPSVETGWDSRVIVGRHAQALPYAFENGRLTDIGRRQARRHALMLVEEDFKPRVTLHEQNFPGSPLIIHYTPFYSPLERTHETIFDIFDELKIVVTEAGLSHVVEINKPVEERGLDTTPPMWDLQLATGADVQELFPTWGGDEIPEEWLEAYDIANIDQAAAALNDWVKRLAEHSISSDERLAFSAAIQLIPDRKEQFVETWVTHEPSYPTFLRKIYRGEEIPTNIGFVEPLTIEFKDGKERYFFRDRSFPQS